MAIFIYLPLVFLIFMILTTAYIMASILLLTIVCFKKSIQPKVTFTIVKVT